jgi:hypothetical protein
MAKNKKNKPVSYRDMFRRSVGTGATDAETKEIKEVGKAARAAAKGADSPNIGIGKVKRLRTKYTPVVKSGGSIGRAAQQPGGYN